MAKAKFVVMAIAVLLSLTACNSKDVCSQQPNPSKQSVCSNGLR